MVWCGQVGVITVRRISRCRAWCSREDARAVRALTPTGKQSRADQSSASAAGCFAAEAPDAAGAPGVSMVPTHTTRPPVAGKACSQALAGAPPLVPDLDRLPAVGPPQTRSQTVQLKTPGPSAETGSI